MEFREMRRKRQQLAEEESIAILEKATAGTLALLGDNDYPYASFCVIEQDDVQPEKYTTFFRSVIAFGRIHIIEDEGGTHDVDNIVGGYHEKLEAARMIGNRYNPNHDEALQKEIENGLSRMLAIRFDIEHLTGKEAIELVRQHQKF